MMWRLDNPINAMFLDFLAYTVAAINKGELSPKCSLTDGEHFVDEYLQWRFKAKMETANEQD